MNKKYILLLIIIVLILTSITGCRYYFSGNYPDLVLDDYSYTYQDIVENDFIIGELTTLTLKLNNRGLSGEFLVHITYNADGEDSPGFWYGPVYINEKLEKPFQRPFYFYFDQDGNRYLPDTSGHAVIYALKKDNSRVKQKEVDF